MKFDPTAPSSRASMNISACFKDMIAYCRISRSRGPSQGAFCGLEISGLFLPEYFPACQYGPAHSSKTAPFRLQSPQVKTYNDGIWSSSASRTSCLLLVNWFVSIDSLFPSSRIVLIA